jgi:DTW domain-containing protein YfiP
VTVAASPAPRALCRRCVRPLGVCVCALLPDLAPATRVLVLQHPKERRVAIGTARMAARCLRGARVVVGTRLDDHPAVAAALADPARRPVLLWPGADAVDLALAPPTGPITLLVVDGTWHTARTLLRDNPRVAALPRYAIAPAAPSEYRIRREPSAECLSTIEALAAALGVLERDPAGYRAMLAPFRAMVDVQLAHAARGNAPRDRARLARRRGRAWAPPPALRDPTRVVVVAVEANAWPAERKAEHEDEVVQWLAARGDASASADVVVRPSGALAPRVDAHTELEEDVLLGGAPRERLAAAVRDFLREGDALATWGGYAVRLLDAAGLRGGHEAFDLRRVAADFLRGSPGSIEACLRELGLAPSPLGRGRGGRRLGQMLAVYREVARGRPAHAPAYAARGSAGLGFAHPPEDAP